MNILFMRNMDERDNEKEIKKKIEGDDDEDEDGIMGIDDEDEKKDEPKENDKVAFNFITLNHLNYIFDKIINSKNYGIYNIGSKYGVSINEILNTIFNENFKLFYVIFKSGENINMIPSNTTNDSYVRVI